MRASMSLHLVVRERGAFLRALPLTQEIVVGRSPTSHVVVLDPKVSREHVRLVPDGDGAAVFDLKSRHGTMLDGQRIAEGRARVGSRSEHRRVCGPEHRGRVRGRHPAPASGRPSGDGDLSSRRPKAPAPLLPQRRLVRELRTVDGVGGADAWSRLRVRRRGPLDPRRARRRSERQALIPVSAGSRRLS